MNNQPRATQVLAISVAMAAISLGAVVVSVATAVEVSRLQNSAGSAEVIDEVWGGLGLTGLGWIVLMAVLALVWRRRPDPDRYTRPFPPLAFLLPAAVGGAAIGMTGFGGGPVYAALFGGVGTTSWVWTACVVLLTEVEEEEEDHAL